MSFMTTHEVSALTGVPIGTLRYWRSVDKGPLSGRLGRTIVYKRLDVETWIEERLASTARGGN